MKVSLTPIGIKIGCAFVLSLLLAGRAEAQSQREELLVSAAASLKDALAEISRRYEAGHPGVTVRHNFASSGTLQRQIEQGAAVDVFIAAAAKNMDELAAKNLIDRATRRTLARNALVLIVPADSTLNLRSFKDLARPSVERIAIGVPASVPAGQYAEQVLRKLGLWEAVQGKTVQCRDVREVLAQVELGNVAAGIVYRSDAAISKKVRSVAAAPEKLHQPIAYPAALVADSKHAATARDYLAFLTSQQARRIWRRYKFIVGK